MGDNGIEVEESKVRIQEVNTTQAGFPLITYHIHKTSIHIVDESARLKERYFIGWFVLMNDI